MSNSETPWTTAGGLPCPLPFPKLAQTHVHWFGDTIQPSHLLLPLLFLPSVFPSIRVFSKESAFRIRWPKYWSFSFSSSPSSEYSGLISFRIDWFDPKHEVKWNVSHSVVPNSLIQSITFLKKLFRSFFLQEAFPDYLRIHCFVCSLIFFVS